MPPSIPRNRIREHREAAGLTQQQLADATGAGRVTINRAEQGTQAPSLALALQLAKALDVRLDDLFGDRERDADTPGMKS